MLKAGIKVAAFNIAGFVLLLGGFYFMDAQGLKSISGYLYVTIGVLCLGYNFVAHFLNKPIKLASYLLLYAAAACMFTMALWRMSIQNWEVPILLLIVAALLVMCGLQLAGKKKFFPA